MRRRPTIHAYDDLRDLKLYNPYRDAARRYPAWQIQCRNLGGKLSELIFPHLETILIDPQYWQGDEPCAIAHAITHLDLHSADLNNLSLRQEQEADDVAHFRLDQLAALI